MAFNGDFIKHQNRLLHLLQSCLRLRSLNTTKPLHALTITLGPNPNQPTFLCNNLISLYASLDDLPMARKVFENMPQRTIVSYNSIITSYCRHDCLEEAWGILCQLKNEGFRPNNFTVSGLLVSPSMGICCGLQLQALSMKNGLFCSDVFVGTALLGFFGRCGWLDEAVQVFEFMPRKSLMTWNSMISLFAHHGIAEDCMLLFCELARNEGGCLSECSFVAILSGLVCGQHLEFGEQVHGFVIKTGFDSKVSVSNSLISVYARCSSINLAEKLFEEADGRDVVAWNTMINAMAKSKQPLKALHYYLKMSKDVIKPNEATFLSLVNSCTKLELSRCGKLVHGQIIIHGFQSDIYLGSALVDYYAKRDKLDDAHHCFDNLPEKNVVSWNSLILAYANRCFSGSISLLIDMFRFGYSPNEFSFSAVLKSSLSALELQQLHCLIIRKGYESNEYVLSSLISSYGRSSLISNALVLITAFETEPAVVPSNIIAGLYNRTGQYHKTLRLLSELREPDNVSWNIAIEACARNGNYKEVVELFKYMLLAKMHPDNYTYISILNVCTKTCALSLGSSIHGFLLKTNFGSCDAFVCNILIDMYGKCGSHKSSVKIFNAMTNRNLISWTALISALGINGCSLEALEKFKEMENSVLRPDKVAFVAVLSACRHGALVQEGMEFFEKMFSYGLEPEMDHYHCLVDLLARHGHVQEAKKVISSMPFPPNSLIWRSFLEGYKRFGIKENIVGRM